MAFLTKQQVIKKAHKKREGEKILETPLLKRMWCTYGSEIRNKEEV